MDARWESEQHVSGHATASDARFGRWHCLGQAPGKARAALASLDRHRLAAATLVAGYLVTIVAANLLIVAFGPAVSVLNAFLFIGLDVHCDRNMIQDDRLNNGDKIDKEAAQDRNLVRADRDHSPKADAQGIVKIFHAAVFIGHLAQVHGGGFPFQGACQGDGGLLGNIQGMSKVVACADWDHAEYGTFFCRDLH